jgi:hypothetical protein
LEVEEAPGYGEIKRHQSGRVGSGRGAMIWGDKEAPDWESGRVGSGRGALIWGDKEAPEWDGWKWKRRHGV